MRWVCVRICLEVRQKPPQYAQTKAQWTWKRISTKIGKRNRLHHINDRGSNKVGPFITPIVESDSIELGNGSLDLKKLLAIDKINETDYVVLEMHKNYIDGSRILSIEISGKYLNENV